MSLKIKIGADELILWLRKNEKAIDIPNDEVQGLGRKIHDIIVKNLQGKKIEENVPSYWAHLMDSDNIGKFNLPKNSAQYEIEVNKLDKLYTELNKL
ncbi:MAG: hypothetical protein WCY06_06950 [Flavobacteriaceae bacterium]